MIRSHQKHNDDYSDGSGSGTDEEEQEDQREDNDENSADEGNDDNQQESEDDEDYFVGDINNSDEEETGNDSLEKNSKNAALSEKEILRAQKKEKKSGVVYMSRVPPFMKPIKVRHLLEKYAEIGRIYLVQEDDKRRKQRLKTGGNRRKQFVEGWIEFTNKKYAKSVASMLNNSQMGGKKHGFYHDDLWNLKYLPKFKWRHLTEQLASEKAARGQKLQSEISQSRKELDDYMKNVERAKMLSSMKAKKEAQAKKGMDVVPMRDRSRNVWQRDVVLRSAEDHATDASRKKTGEGKGKGKGNSSSSRGNDDEDDGHRSNRGSDSKRRKTMASVLDQIF
ncbi:RNA-binding ATPase activator esf2 [Coemansia sp. RSA 1722]|nr:RNA-binding ATPase activator esf2 [Coemansia sp. RSA 485]KAJ2600636.1 RNA-binding ATPase activator esf2 [Coemansia sp. RSA 1722]